MKEKEILEKILKLGRIIVVLLGIMLVVLTVGVSKMYSDTTNSTSTQDSEYNTEYDVSMFKEISASDIKKETKGKLNVVYVGRETCSWCAAFLPNLWEAQEKYDYTTLYVDIAKIIDFNTGNIIDESAYSIMMDLTGDNYDDYMEQNFGSTPMILIMKDNKIVSAQTGYSEYDAFETILNEAGIK